DTKGNWAETEYSITTSEIPAAVKTTINKEYSSYKIKGIDVSETPKGKIVEVIFVKGKKKVEVVFDENGKVTKE
ncbi:MAG: PepSY-like domain-containing protein, partial [Paludibacter sp.]